MLNRRSVVVVLLSLCLGLPAAPSVMADMDIAAFSRVTASDTLDTFFLLWPRETDDGAFTARDGSPETGWKTPYAGTSVLVHDFAPVLTVEPSVARLEAEWYTPPVGVVRVSVARFCGGSLIAEAEWLDPAEPFVFDPPVKARCLFVTVEDPGFAVLGELRIFAADTGSVPALLDARLSKAKRGLTVEWTADDGAAFVRIDYRDAPGEPLSDDTRIDVVPAHRAWRGPWPVHEDGRIALTPLTVAGEPGETVSLDPATVDDLPYRPNMGTIEGFYGTPWSDAERRQLMLMMARFGFGSYLYQPKWDLLNREQWRTPYSDAQIERFAALRRFAERVGVRLIFGMGPAFDMIVDDPDERAVLLEKLAPLVEAGFRDFELGFDDIEFSNPTPIDGVTGAKHVELVNWTQDQLGAMAGEPVNMWMMPTPYSTDRQNNYFPDGDEYMDELINLRDGIHVLWNGPDTFARGISAADLEDVTARTGRKPVIWENMHCNDAGDAFIGKFYLAPMMNRAADMMDAAEGFMTNPLIPGAANRVVLGSYALYADDPAGYDPGRAIAESIAEEVEGAPDRALMLRMSSYYWGLGILGPPGNSVTRNRPMEDAMDALRSVRGGTELRPIAAAGGALLRVAADMAVLHGELHHSGLAPDLVDDLWYPAQRLVDEGRALLTLMDWFGARLAGNDDPAALTRAERMIVNSLLHDRYHTSQLRLLAFKRQMEKTTVAAGGFAAPIIAPPTSLTTFASEEWSYDTGVTSGLSSHGLPGAPHRDGVLRWRAPHAGTWNVIVTAEGPEGWAWREFVLTVRDAPDDAGDADDGADDDGNELDPDSVENDELDGTTGGCGC